MYPEPHQCMLEVHNEDVKKWQAVLTYCSMVCVATYIDKEIIQFVSSDHDCKVMIVQDPMINFEAS